MGAKLRIDKRWLLDRLPVWKYLCPACQEPLGYINRPYICPQCHEYVESPIRVPPWIKKEDKEILSDYVHTHIMPKLSEKHQSYLAKWFTNIFTDGQTGSTMETLGDFSAWTGTSGSPTVTTSYHHHGANCAEFDAIEYCYKTITPMSHVFMRCYVRLTSLPTADGDRLLILFLADSNTHGVSCEIWYSTALGLHWVMYYYTTSWQSLTTTSSLPTTGVWYCLEIEWYSGVRAQFWKDDISLLSATSGILTSNIVTAYAGAYFNVGTKIMQEDCWVIADAYIGPEGAVPSVLTLDATDMGFDQ